MSQTWHNMRCEVIADRPQKDRFFMDLSVYEIREWPVVEDVEGESLIWRGLYIALDPTATAAGRRQARPFGNFLN